MRVQGKQGCVIVVDVRVYIMCVCTKKKRKINQIASKNFEIIEAIYLYPWTYSRKIHNASTDKIIFFHAME